MPLCNPAIPSLAVSCFYDILLKRKFQKPCYQSILARDFDITGSIWQTIYDNKVKHILDRDIAEFNYKILNNLICTNYYLSKWKVGQTKYCKICTNEVEYTKHLIYNCSITKRIWNIVSFTLKFEVEWKHIVLGFYNSKSDYIDFLNYLISFIACKIYKYRMFCRLESLDENTYRPFHNWRTIRSDQIVVRSKNLDLDRKLLPK